MKSGLGNLSGEGQCLFHQTCVGADQPELMFTIARIRTANSDAIFSSSLKVSNSSPPLVQLKVKSSFLFVLGLICLPNAFQKIRWTSELASVLKNWRKPAIREV